MTRPSKAKAIARLRKALDAIPGLKKLRHGSQEFEKWRRDTRLAINNTFVDIPSRRHEFGKISFSALYLNLPDSELQKAYLKGLESAATLLESMIGEIEEYWEDENQTPTTSVIPQNGQIDSKKVFVVHGRDNEARKG